MSRGPHRKRQANSNQHDWTLGSLRRLKRLLDAGLTYTELGRVFLTTRNSIASTVVRYGLNLSPDEIAERQARAGKERATTGRRSVRANDWEALLTERWADRKARRATGRQDAPA